MLNNFQWHRRMIGGTWYKTRLITLQGAVFAWTQEPTTQETIVDTEGYGK